MKATRTQLKRWTVEWLSLLAQSNESDYRKASLATKMFDFVGMDRRRFYALLKQLGITASGTKGMLWDMVAALRAVPDQDVWIAVGWDGVRRLMEQQVDRLEATKRILAAAQGGKLPKAKAARIICGGKPALKRDPEYRKRYHDRHQFLEALVALVEINPANEAVLHKFPEALAAVKKRLKRTA